MNLQEQISRMKSMMGLLVENNHYYDEILDLYSEVGIEGMEDDEVDYLKSGGQTELPKRFKLKKSQEEYDNYQINKSFEVEELKTEEWQDIFDLQKIIDQNNENVICRFDFDSVGWGLNMLCNLVFDYSEETLKRLQNMNYHKSDFLTHEDGKIIYTIPKTWLNHLNNIEIDDTGNGNDDRPVFI